MLGIVRELKRRNVTRVAGAYAVVGWLVAQVAVTLEESLELPGWFDATVVLLLLIGFPVALVLSWAFDLTPEGVKRTPDAVSEAELPRAGAADVAVVVALVAVVGLVGYQLLSFIRGDQPSENAPIETASIAVLPFSDMSDTGDQEYFSEGLSEEILNVLAKVDGMKVASRTSSFSFKGSDADVTKIGELLGVQHVLEGSVRKADKRLRITAQLIRAEDGFHVWSETYEKELDDVFAIQDDIANQILAELRGRIMGDAPTVAVSRAEVTAYDLVLRAQKVSETYSLPGLEAGAELYRQAIDIDPSYARAYAGLAAVELLNSNATGALGERPVADVIPVARDLLNRALELAPDDAAVWSRVGLLRQFAGDVAGAEEAYAKARELQPNVNMNNYAIMLGQQDRAIDAAALLAQQKEVNPRDEAIRGNLIAAYALLGRFDEAERELAEFKEQFPDVKGQFAPVHVESILRMRRGEWARSVEIAQAAYDKTPSVLPVAMQVGFSSLVVRDYDRAMSVGNPMLSVFVNGFANDAGVALSFLQPYLESGNMPPMIHSSAILMAGTASDYERIADRLLPLWPKVGDTPACENIQYPHGYVALAYLELERQPEFNDAMSCWDKILQARVARGRTDGNMHFSLGFYKALDGDVEGALDEMEIALSDGQYDHPFLDTTLINLGLDRDPRGRKLIQDYLDKLNRERAKLDLPPIESPIAI